MYYTNAHVFNVAVGTPSLRQALNSADLVLCEGYGGVIGARFAGTQPAIPESLNTMEWIDDYLSLVAARRRSVFLLGEEPGVADACAAAMVGKHPGLDVVGTHHGFFDRTGDDNLRVLELIREADPDVLLVGMGSPIQEAWIEDNLEALPEATVMALGAMFRWYSGTETPWASWMLRWHLGWFGRLLRHPIRHFRRYVIGNPLFLLRCLRQRFTTT